MDHSIVLRLTPVFAGEPPLIRVDINGNTIFHNKLKTEEEIKHVTAITSSVKIKIKDQDAQKKLLMRIQIMASRYLISR